jgi:hypothetical protein
MHDILILSLNPVELVENKNHNLMHDILNLTEPVVGGNAKITT